MKKKAKKLVLARETVHGLNAPETAKAAGGMTEVYSCTGASGCYTVPKTCETLCLC